MATKSKKGKTAANTEDNAGTRFEFDGEILEFDIESLTFGEVEFIEEYFGCPLDLVPWESGRGSLVGSYLALRRKGRDVSLDDLRKLKINVLKRDVGEGDAAGSPKAR